MIGRFVKWLLPFALAGAVVLVLVALAILLAPSWTPSTPRSEAVLLPSGSDHDPVSGLVQPQSGAPKIPTGVAPSGMLPASVAGAPLIQPSEEEPAAIPAGLGDPSPGSANQKVQVAMGSGLDPTTGLAADPPLAVGPATPNQLPATPNSGSCLSPCAVDVSEWDIPTPEPPTFNGLHPIADSWRVGVASGKASHMGDRFPSWYLALPIGPGFKVRIVGAGGHVEMWSTDAGPSLQKQREGRVADLSVAVFVHVCGVPASFGLCPVSISVLGRR